jgi:hypothetical protein
MVCHNQAASSNFVFVQGVSTWTVCWLRVQTRAWDRSCLSQDAKTVPPIGDDKAHQQIADVIALQLRFATEFSLLQHSCAKISRQWRCLCSESLHSVLYDCFDVVMSKWRHAFSNSTPSGTEDTYMTLAAGTDGKTFSVHPIFQLHSALTIECDSLT